METKLTSISIVIRKRTLARLLTEDCIITHFTLHSYVYDILVSEALGFKDMFYESIDDIKIVLGIYKFSYKDSK